MVLVDLKIRPAGIVVGKVPRGVSQKRGIESVVDRTNLFRNLGKWKMYYTDARELARK